MSTGCPSGNRTATGEETRQTVSSIATSGASGFHLGRRRTLLQLPRGSITAHRTFESGSLPAQIDPATALPRLIARGSTSQSRERITFILGGQAQMLVAPLGQDMTGRSAREHAA